MVQQVNSDKLKAKIEALWKEGRKVREIAAAVGKSRNAVLGIVHRMGLEARPSPIKRGGAAVEAKLKPEARAAALAEALVVPKITINKAPVPKFSRKCCWPLGEPGTPQFRYCGAPGVVEGVYCALHEHVSVHGWNGVDDPEGSLWTAERDKALLRLVPADLRKLKGVQREAAFYDVARALNEFPGRCIDTAMQIENRWEILRKRGIRRAA